MPLAPGAGAAVDRGDRVGPGAGGRGEHDDLALLRLDHRRQHRLQAVEHHVEVHALDAFPLVDRHVEELADHDQPGDQARRVEPPEPIERRGDECLVALGGRQVDVGDRVDGCAERFECRHLLGERHLDADHRVVAGRALQHEVVAAASASDRASAGPT